MHADAWHGDGRHTGGYYGGGFHGPAVVYGYYQGGCWGCGAAAIGVAVAATTLAVGAMVASALAGCSYQYVDGANYHICGSTWRQPITARTAPIIGLSRRCERRCAGLSTIKER